MTNPPADWYDDPEDPAQYRYWNGTSWTDHRSPKQIPPPPSAHRAGGSAWNIFPTTFNAIGAAWRNLLLISLPNLVISGLVLVLVYATIDQVFDGNIEAILDRVGDGVVSAEDERFFESLDPVFPVPMFWPLLVAVLASIVVGSVVSAALGRATAATIRGRELSAGDALRGGLRRLGRILGWSLVAVAAAIIALVPALIVPFLFLLYVPLMIWLWPFGVAFVASLAIAPAGRSPFKQAIELLRGRWGAAATRCLVLTLLWVSVAFGGAVVNQIFAFDLRASVVGSSLSQVVQGILVTAGVTAWWTELDGPLDPELDSG